MIRPLVVSFIGPRPTLIFGGIFYVLFIAQIMYPMNILLYMGSALLGFGGAMMWVAQGHFLTINSRSGSCTSELQLKVNCRLGWSASQLFARAGSGHFLFWPGSAWAFWPWASSGYRFWHMLGQFLPIFQLRGQFLRFGLGRATQNLARVRSPDSALFFAEPRFFSYNTLSVFAIHLYMIQPLVLKRWKEILDFSLPFFNLLKFGEIPMCILNFKIWLILIEIQGSQ